MKIDLSGLKPMNEDEKVPCGIDGLMIDMGESKEFVMELWAKSDSFFDGYHAKKKEEIVRCKDCKYSQMKGGTWGDCHNPIFGDGWGNYPPPSVNEDGYCAWGEER